MESAQAVMDLLDASFTSASLGAALELGLFWVIDERPVPVDEIAARLEIRHTPCACWLQLLEQAGFVEKAAGGYRASALARRAIVRTHSPGTWAMLAQEARERVPVLLDLPTALRTGKAAEAMGRRDYVTLMQEDRERARRFTRMLYELHREWAGLFAAHVDLAGVRRLIDIGGGSGVVSLALADRDPALTAVVVDIENVCIAGRELARERGLADRVSFQPADITSDQFPAGFDLAVMCDVGLYRTAMFSRIAAALVSGGRLIVADAFAPQAGVAPRSRAHWALERAVTGRDSDVTAADVQAMLRNAGFDLNSAVSPLPGAAETIIISAFVRR